LYSYTENQLIMETEIITGTRKCSGVVSSIGDALYVIGGKWKLRVIAALREGHCRFNEIQRATNGISARVLSNELKELELNGFISRSVHPGTPVVVEYHITAYADSLHDVLSALADWGVMHRDKLRAER
jgi:DNA-binding HxlR family transcriptional regulator